MPEIERRYLRGDPRRKRKKKKQPSSNDNPWHDERGRFKAGNPGGPGNPFVHKVSALRRALLEEVSEEALRQLVRQLLRRGLKLDSATGNTAAKLLMDRVIGKSPMDAEEQAIQNDIDNRYDPNEVFD